MRFRSDVVFITKLDRIVAKKKKKAVTYVYFSVDKIANGYTVSCDEDLSKETKTYVADKLALVQLLSDLVDKAVEVIE